MALAENLDYGVVFVGGYDAGDVQYLRHVALDSHNLLYWKTSKDFADGCSSHLLGGRYSNGHVAFADQGAFRMERALTLTPTLTPTQATSPYPTRAPF